MSSETLRRDVLHFISDTERAAYPDIFAAFDEDVGQLFLATVMLYRNGKIDRVGPGEFRRSERIGTGNHDLRRSSTGGGDASDFRWHDVNADELTD